MKTIYKLVLKSYLGPMVLTFFIIMFVLMMNVLWRYIDELVGKGNLAGLALSYNFEVSPGAAIIFTLTVTLILVKLLTLLVKKRRRADENHL